MYRTPPADHDGMKVWLGADEGEVFLTLVEDTTHRIALSRGLRCGLRSAEIVAVTPADLATGPSGTMLRVGEEAAKGDKYRETSVPPDLETTIRTVDDVRPEPSDAPLVDASTRTVRRWVKRYAERRPRRAPTTDGATSPRTTSGGRGRHYSPAPRTLTRCSAPAERVKDLGMVSF